jgi:hypothetical protein
VAERRASIPFELARRDSGRIQPSCERVVAYTEIGPKRRSGRSVPIGPRHVNWTVDAQVIHLARVRPSNPFGPRASLKQICPQSPSTARTAIPANRIDNHPTRHNQNPLKTNTQRHSQSRIPAADMLYSRRVINVFHRRSVLRTTARRFVERQNSLAPHRLPHRPQLRHLFAKLAIRLPDRQPPTLPPPIDRI